MYPVFSLLRRLASAHIYATDPMLEVVDGAYHIRLDKPSGYLDMGKRKWTAPTELVPFSSIEVPAKSSAAAAISIARRENEIAEEIRAHDILYTMVVGPEQEIKLTGGAVRRCCTYTLVRGVYRASSTVLKQQAVKGGHKVQFRKPPPGTVRL
jgi:hypothetical protein